MRGEKDEDRKINRGNEFGFGACEHTMDRGEVDQVVYQE